MRNFWDEHVTCWWNIVRIEENGSESNFRQIFGTREDAEKICRALAADLRPERGSARVERW